MEKVFRNRLLSRQACRLVAKMPRPARPPLQRRASPKNPQMRLSTQQKFGNRFAQKFQHKGSSEHWSIRLPSSAQRAVTLSSAIRQKKNQRLKRSRRQATASNWKNCSSKPADATGVSNSARRKVCRKRKQR